MASDLAKSLSTASGVTVNDNDLYSLTTQSMQNPGNLPSWQAGMDFRSYGTELKDNPDLFNDYLSSLVKQIGVLFQKPMLWQNKLDMFRKGLLTAGGLENVIYDTIDPEPFDPNFRDRNGNIRSPYEPNYNSPKISQFIELYDVNQNVTLQDTIDQQYFQTLDQLHNYVYAQICALVNGVNGGSYAQAKLTLSEAVAQNKMTVYNIKDSGDEKKNTAAIVKQLNLLSRKFQYLSSAHNAMGVTAATDPRDIVVILPLNTSVSMDMDYFSTMFNPEVSRLNVQVTEIDEFPDVWRYSKDHVVTQTDIDNGYVNIKSDGKEHHKYQYWRVGDTIKAGAIAMPGAPDAVKVIDGSKIAGIVLDKDAFQIWNVLPTTLAVKENPRGRYANIWINHKSLYSFVSGLNAEAIYTSDAESGPVTFVPDKTHTVSPDKGK